LRGASSGALLKVASQVRPSATFFKKLRRPLDFFCSFQPWAVISRATGPARHEVGYGSDAADSPNRAIKQMGRREEI
jgi:hypothetical protein